MNLQESYFTLKFQIFILGIQHRESGYQDKEELLMMKVITEPMSMAEFIQSIQIKENAIFLECYFMKCKAHNHLKTYAHIKEYCIPPFRKHV